MKNFNNNSVRRRDRLLNEELATDILLNGEYGILSMVETKGDSFGGYGTPINYVWDGGLYIYFHCAPEGHKLECVDSHPEVSFCVVGKTKVISNKFTTNYQSVIVRGNIEHRLTIDERMYALKLILQKYAPEDMGIGLKYAEKSFHRTEILRLEIEHISAKAKQVSL